LRCMEIVLDITKMRDEYTIYTLMALMPKPP